MPAARQLRRPAPAARRRPAPTSATAERVVRRREQILAAATVHFARSGYHGADVQVLADELGLGKGTLYRHFATKQALFLAAVDRVMRLLGERIDALRAAGRDPLALVAAAVVEYLAFFDAHPEFVELLILERAVFRQRKKPTYFEHRERRVERWRALIRDLMAAGRVRAGPPELITDVLSSALYGTMFTNFFAGRKKSLQTQARELLGVVYHGILTDAERLRHPPARRDGDLEP